MIEKHSIIKLRIEKQSKGVKFIHQPNKSASCAVLLLSVIFNSTHPNNSLPFKQFIIWNKRFDVSSKKGFLDGFIVREKLNNWNKMAEYILFYTFDNSWKLKEERKKRNISQQTIQREILSKNGNITGWYSNIETGKNLPTKETIKPITKHLGLTIEDLVPKYHNLKKDHSVWNYDFDNDKKEHETQKPISLIENIISHTTDENDIVLDCFMGSGTTGVACKNLKRKFIGIEKEKKFFELSKNRILGQYNKESDLKNHFDKKFY